MKYISNAFSFQMVDEVFGKLKFAEIKKEDFEFLSKGAKSCIGHKDLAKILNLPYNRRSVRLNKGDILYVAQLTGGRLPEGATHLPEEVELKYLEIKYV